MKCTTTREQLLAPLTHAERTVGKNLSLPVLACVLLEVSEDTLSITATNLEVGVRYRLPIADAKPGKLAVPGHILTHVISSLPSGTSLTLEHADGVLAIKSTGGTSRLTTQDMEDFPALPKVEGGRELVLPTKALMDAIVSVAYCASTSSIKPELASVFVYPNGSELVAAATDSFRLSERRVALKSAVTSDPFLIPARSVPDVVRVLEQAGDEVVLQLNDHQLSVQCGGVYMTARLTSGTFPDYTAIIPKEFVAEATMLTRDLERVLKKAVAFSDQFNQTTVRVDPDAKLFTIHTENAKVGETTDTIPATLTGESLEIRFNHRYILEALHSTATDSVVMRFSGKSHPALIEPVGDVNFRYLVMPMNR